MSSWQQNILELASAVREQYAGWELDRIAEARGILLIRTAGKKGGPDGFSSIEYAATPEYIESLARPDEPLRVWEPQTKEKIRSIVLNTNSEISEAEIFWHEWYHLFYSPESIQHIGRFEHRFSGHLLDSKEERRADEFAATVLVPTLDGCETVLDIMERFEVSERLAAIAARLYRSL